MEKYKVVVKGVRPLLVKRFPMEDISAKKSKRGVVFDAERDAEKALYRDTDGKIFLPAIHFEGAMIKGAASIIKKGKKTFKDTVAQSVIVMPRELRFKTPEDPEKFVIDVQTAVNPSTRGRNPIARPRWDEWRFEFEIWNEADDDINVETMEEILSESGKVGVGTFRLKYGKYIVESIEKV